MVWEGPAATSNLIDSPHSYINVDSVLMAGGLGRHALGVLGLRRAVENSGC